MDVIRAIETRQSMGRVRQDPVPKELIERILESAVHAPNHRLTEPWRFHVFTGKGRGELARARAEIASLQANYLTDITATVSGVTVGSIVGSLSEGATVVTAGNRIDGMASGNVADLQIGIEAIYIGELGVPGNKLRADTPDVLEQQLDERNARHRASADDHAAAIQL
jgi:nitroreductase